jgi:hypothetical protein
MNNTPWLDEPTEFRWIDEATGLPCWARRVDKRAPWYAHVGFATTESVDVDDACVHGGVTFLGEIPIDSLADAMWLDHAGCNPLHARRFGFDCYHEGDFIPWMPNYPGTWRSLDFVRAECAKLARAIKDALDEP